jgi:hypothetical protein
MSDLLPLSRAMARIHREPPAALLHARDVTREFSRTGGVWTLRGSAH